MCRVDCSSRTRVLGGRFLRCLEQRAHLTRVCPFSWILDASRATDQNTVGRRVISRSHARKNVIVESTMSNSHLRRRGDSTAELSCVVLVRQYQQN